MIIVSVLVKCFYFDRPLDMCSAISQCYGARGDGVNGLAPEFSEYKQFSSGGICPIHTWMDDDDDECFRTIGG